MKKLPVLCAAALTAVSAENLYSHDAKGLMILESLPAGGRGDSRSQVLDAAPASTGHLRLRARL
jgi:hypothetical protein